MKLPVTLKKILLVTVVGALSSCVSTKLEPYTLTDGAQRLLTLEHHQTNIVFEHNALEVFEGTLGHQYLLFFIPFGEITLTDARKHIENTLTTALVEIPQRDRRHLTELHVTKVNTSVTAYDLFFMRRVLCTISIEINGRFVGTARESFWHPKPFKVELMRAFSKATLTAARQVISSSANDF